jgi:hypothetical protein
MCLHACSGAIIEKDRSRKGERVVVEAGAPTLHSTARTKWHEGGSVARVAFVEAPLVHVERIVARRRWVSIEREDLPQLRILVCTRCEPRMFDTE